MAKMGFSPQTTPFRPSPLCPPYLWFCRSCTQRCSFSSPSYAFGRTEDKAPKMELLDLNHVSNARRFRNGIGDDYYPKRMISPYSALRKPHPDSVEYGRRDEDNREYILNRGYTIGEWSIATEACKQSKRHFVHTNNTSPNLQAIPVEETISGNVMFNRRNTCQGEASRISRNEIDYTGTIGQHRLHTQMPVLQLEKNVTYRNEADKKTIYPRMPKSAHLNGLEKVGYQGSLTTEDNINKKEETDSFDSADETYIEKITAASETNELHERLGMVYDKVLVVDSIPAAREIVHMLTNQYRDLIHACDTEVANISVKEETPVGHGEIICFSIYSGLEADFGDGKSCIWIDVLDGGGEDILAEFAPFFEDPSIKKVWHNYSFDNHIIENYGFKVAGFYADTMHMARLWNSARRTQGGYSLEALTSSAEIMSDAKKGPGEKVIGKVSMKNIFGRKKLKKDGCEGKIITIPPVEELQRVERKLWICYSALDSISTLMLFESLEKKLLKTPWTFDGRYTGSMFKFYEQYMRPFGQLLVKMETEGMLVDRSYLAEIEKVAKVEQQVAADRFRKWASKYCPDAKYMNIGSDTQLRQIFFGGIQNRKDPNEFLPLEKEFRVPNIDSVIEEGKKSPLKHRKILLRKPDGLNIETDKYTASGWPSMSGDTLKTLAGKVSADFEFVDDENDEEFPEMIEGASEDTGTSLNEDHDTSAYGTAYSAFGGGLTGIEACHAIAALCEVCSIDSLISNFILPLQGKSISGKNGRIHCSLNINTETGRLSARRPNLQNQPALEKDRYKIRQAFIAAPGNSLIVADYGQLELRILAHLANCESMLNAFKAGGDFHSRTAMNMYPHIRAAVERNDVLLEWHPQPGQDKPPVPLLKDAFASERRKAKMLNFSIAYGKTTVGLARDWKVSRKEAQETVDLWYSDRKEVLAWQEQRKKEARMHQRVYTLLGRPRHFPSLRNATSAHKNHIERAAINTPVQGSAADVAMCAMLEISKNARLKELGWRLLLQVHDEVILEGPSESAEEAKDIVVDCMCHPFNGKNILRVGLSVDAKCAQNWYSAK